MSTAHLVPLYRYMNNERWDHLYSHRCEEIGESIPGQVGKSSYRAEGVQCHILSRQHGSAVPLYRYYNEERKDHHYTSDDKEMGTTREGQMGKSNYKCEGIVGYVYRSQEKDTIPLHRYYHEEKKDHFLTTRQENPSGYKYEKIECYVY